MFAVGTLHARRPLAHEIFSARTGTTVLGSLFTVMAIVSQFAWSCEAVHLWIASPGEEGDLRTTPIVTCSCRTRYRLRDPR